MLHIVEYNGPFGFIKPWTAVRDSETYSQQFLTPSIVEGIEKKLFPELLGIEGGVIRKIVRHRLSYRGLSSQQERTQAKGWENVTVNKAKHYFPKRSIITRGIMLEPRLHLAFSNEADALCASEQSICLCRNEDLLFPEPEILKMTIEEFESDIIPGFELLFTSADKGFKVGQNRFREGNAMFGELAIFGNPIR
jgi:hypothetical protein